ncbi:Phosphotransferase involved in threonylcarbamoyladenosine t(6)A37 formation in tRNA [Methylomonas albis]|uniref:Phosphotransferase n=1 Tax=Methylomonas albis TaxID=1854563 RepID=A0ABR9D5T7_9GAMM|nr:phosphotransferase [Methylomonas albis]MBD9357579.1 phosphotransferase [Methylomonas albis]CAD6880877.1 Phosphotransferase involved in threonylcarbamoyladenosine t(6)A37 formation in tRNA [Methylomonas albis]
MYVSSLDRRLAELVDWLNNDLALDIQQISPASSDASFRRYFRVEHRGGSHIAMDAPPDKENTEPFVRIAGLLKPTDIHVPNIFWQNSRQGFLLLEDLGSTSYLDHLQMDNAETLYRQALDSLLKLQIGVNTDNCGLPAYDRALLLRELGIFYEWFLEKLLGIAIPDTVATPLNNILIQSALEQPQVCVHRDYHSRNLMFLEHASPGIIDFQDAVIGPISYDLISLLRDCYIAWPEQQVISWAQDYHQRLCVAGLLQADFNQFRRWLDLMGMQRHLKAVGIFARLHLRDGKSNYLADIPRTLAYISTVCEHYPELAAMRQFLQAQVLPAYRASV